jgi:hypothetical protein
MFILFYGFRWFSDTTDEVRIHTYVFTTFILLQVANMLQSRVLGGGLCPRSLFSVVVALVRVAVPVPNWTADCDCVSGTVTFFFFFFLFF